MPNCPSISQIELRGRRREPPPITGRSPGCSSGGLQQRDVLVLRNGWSICVGMPTAAPTQSPRLSPTSHICRAVDQLTGSLAFLRPSTTRATSDVKYSVSPVVKVAMNQRTQRICRGSEEALEVGSLRRVHHRGEWRARHCHEEFAQCDFIKGDLVVSFRETVAGTSSLPHVSLRHKKTKGHQCSY